MILENLTLYSYVSTPWVMSSMPTKHIVRDNPYSAILQSYKHNRREAPIFDVYIGVRQSM